MRRPSILLGAALFAAGRGGIARVARSMASCLSDLDYRLTLLSLLDEQHQSLCGQPIQSSSKSKIMFALNCHSAAMQSTHAVYDSAGIARAHPRWPGLKRPYAVFIHGIEVWEGLRPDRAAAIRRADLVLVNSAYTLGRFQRLHGPLHNAQVCLLGTEQDSPPVNRPDFAGPPTVLILSRMEGGESYKGHDHLIRAWPAITAAVPHARLLIAGAGSDYQRIHQMAEDSPAAQSIEMLGYIAEDALPALWRRAHIFAMPSTCEGFGLVYAEAMRQGLPVVASIHDAGAEVNAHNETGFNVDLNNPTDLRDRLLSLLTNPALLRKFAGAADERWRVLFRASAFRDRFQPQIMQFVERTAASKH